jgi:RNA polymerase sigma-70 factor (ECF subfamily)
VAAVRHEAVYTTLHPRSLRGDLSSSAATRFPVTPPSEECVSGDAREKRLRDTGKDASDEILLTRTAGGDQEALGQLFNRYARLVHSVAVRILRDIAEAEDLTQDLFLFIQRKCFIFDSSRSSARSWIVQMTYHRAIERRRYLTTRHFYARKEIPRDAERKVGIPATESDYSVEVVFGRNGLEKVLEALSEDQRETLRLHFFEGYTLTEISTMLTQPLGNVRHHYYRALDKLRAQMFGTNVQGS